jgi:hypothetical protein
MLKRKLSFYCFYLLTEESAGIFVSKRKRCEFFPTDCMTVGIEDTCTTLGLLLIVLLQRVKTASLGNI